MIDTETLGYLNERSQNIKRYSDKLSETLKDIDNILTPIIDEVKISFIDSERLSYDTDTEYGLEEYFLVMKYDAFGPSGLTVKTVFDGETVNYKWIYDVSRYLQIKAVKRLPVFLEAYGNYLRKKELSYQEVSDMAENMLNVIRKE